MICREKTKISDVNDQSNVDILDANKPLNVDDSEESELEDGEYRMDTDDQELHFSGKLLITDIADLAEMCKSKCGTKYLSTLLYMSLRFFKIKWEDID